LIRVVRYLGAGTDCTRAVSLVRLGNKVLTAWLCLSGVCVAQSAIRILSWSRDICDSQCQHSIAFHHQFKVRESIHAVCLSGPSWTYFRHTPGFSLGWHRIFVARQASHAVWILRLEALSWASPAVVSVFIIPLFSSVEDLRIQLQRLRTKSSHSLLGCIIPQVLNESDAILLPGPRI
jgi:hypothetical protein